MAGGAYVLTFDSKNSKLLGVDEGAGKEMGHCDLALQEALHFVGRKGAVHYRRRQ